MNTLVCVLKSGLWKPWAEKPYTVQYDQRHVLWLRDQCAKQLQPHRFVCMTDMEIPGVETLPLRDNLPGWWSKMEVFREFQRAAFLDLSTVILGDPSETLFSGHKFLISANMTRRHGVNSGVMSWNGDYSFLYEGFIAEKERIMREYTKARQWGDQDFIKEAHQAVKGPLKKFQEYWPEAIISYRYDYQQRGQIVKVGARRRVRLRQEWWKEPRLVKFHGAPKPAEVQDLHDWIPKLCAA